MTTQIAARQVQEGRLLTHEPQEIYEDATKLFMSTYSAGKHRHCPLGHPGMIGLVDGADETDAYLMSAAGTLNQWFKLKVGKLCCGGDVIIDDPKNSLLVDRIVCNMVTLYARHRTVFTPVQHETTDDNHVAQMRFVSDLLDLWFSSVEA